MNLVATLKRRQRRFKKSLGLGLGVSLVISLASYWGYFERFESKALDLLFWLRGQVRSSEIVLVQIDDQAFRQLGEKQPLPRSYLASIIDLVAQAGAKVIGLDIELRVSTTPDEDKLLLTAIQSAAENGNSKVVPVYLIRPEREEGERVLYSAPSFFSPDLTVVTGFGNAKVDSDGLVRQIPLAVKGHDGKILPSLAIAVLARHAGYDEGALRLALNRHEKIKLSLPERNIFAGDLPPRLTPFYFELEDSWKINFAGGRGSFKTIPSDPVVQLASQRPTLAADNPFRDKIVLIGASFQESRDFYPTPHGLMNGVEIHANIIHTILTRSQIQPVHRLMGFVILVIFAVLTSLFLTLFRPALVTVLSLIAIPIILVPLSYLLFAYLGLWVDFVTPVLVMRVGGLIGDFFESRHIRKSLGEYVDREVASQIVNQEDTLVGEKKEVTVFFTDVRNYTTLCESMLPERVVTILNELFSMMGAVITRHHGCIVDFIGDAVLAVFGAPKYSPNHAHDAVKLRLSSTRVWRHSMKRGKNEAFRHYKSELASTPVRLTRVLWAHEIEKNSASRETP